MVRPSRAPGSPAAGLPLLLSNDGMNSSDFIEAVGAWYLNDAFGTSSGYPQDGVHRLFLRQLRGLLRRIAGRTGRRPLQDAGAIVALATAKAGSETPRRSRRRSRRWPRGGEKIFAGGDELAKALARSRKANRSSMKVIGPAVLDQYGDITGPFRLWRIKDGEVTGLSARRARPMSIRRRAKSRNRLALGGGGGGRSTHHRRGAGAFVSVDQAIADEVDPTCLGLARSTSPRSTGRKTPAARLDAFSHPTDVGEVASAKRDVKVGEFAICDCLAGRWAVLGRERMRATCCHLGDTILSRYHDGLF